MPARRFVLGCCLVLLVCPLLMAMGFGGGEGPTSVPEPEQNWRVRLTDVSGQSVELTEFSLDAQTFVLGKMGEGQVAVPFAKVKSLELAQLDGKLTAQVALDDGQSVKLAMRPKLPAYGKTRFGNFKIDLGEVNRVEFLGRKIN